MNTFETDPFGFPLLPENVDMDRNVREMRLQKGIEANKIHHEIWAREDSTADQKNVLEYQRMTNPEETAALIKTQLLGKILAKEEEGFVPEYGPRFGETTLVGVHWLTDQHTNRVYLSIWGHQIVEGELYGFDVTVLGDDHSIYNQEELAVLCELADAKTYDIQ